MNTCTRYSMINGTVVEDHIAVLHIEGKTSVIVSYQSREIAEPSLMQLNEALDNSLVQVY